MCTTHEVGHLVGGWLSGAKLQSWSLAPWSLPYSLHNPDPYPLVTLWAGPFLGVLMPIAAALLLKRDWAWFVAHFCVLANGIYLAIAWFTMDRYLDTQRLLDAGSPRWSLFAYCLITISIGYIQFRKSCIKVLD